MTPHDQYGWVLHLIWASPFLLVVWLIAAGKVGSIGAGLVAAVGASVVSLSAAPVRLTPSGLIYAASEGAWLAFLVGTVIFGGLFFRNVAAAGGGAHAIGAGSAAEPRAHAFTACFLVGPFTEAATGFGVGQVAAVAMLSPLGLPPARVVLLALFSQTLVPWGALANGTMVGATFAGLPPFELGLYSAFLTVPLLLGWLLAFWTLTAETELRAGPREAPTELAWVLAVAGGLIITNASFGPEVAALAVLGPLIALRFWWVERPDRNRWAVAVRLGLPYAVLIAVLVTTRGVHALEAAFSVAAVRPFPDAPAWSPFLHPATWLIVIGGAMTLVMGRPELLVPAMRDAWGQGRKAVLTIALFLVAARVIADSGVAGALATALRAGLGPLAIVATPSLAGMFGFLTGSSNATNGLLMVSQVSLAAASGVPLAWVAASQNTAAAALTMLSPARVAMGCALVGRRDLEPQVYREAWPLGALALATLTSTMVIFLWIR